MSTFMRPLLSLPNELLHTIIEYIAYTPVFPGESRLIHKPELTRSSVNLLALSVVNRRLRRVCLPFLFARIRICNYNVEELDKNVVLFSRFTKILVIDLSPRFYTAKDEDISRALHQFEQLLYVELRYYGTALLRTLLAHPTVTSVLVSGLPDQSMHNEDLSKMVLRYHTPSESLHPDLARCLNHGMKLSCLEFYAPDHELLDTEFRSSTLPGLEEITIQLHDTDFPISFSWLSVLSSNHPTLNQLWLLDEESCYLNLHTPLFISSFEEKSVCQDLKRGFDVQRIGLRRAIGPSSQEWFVMAITLTATTATTSLIQMLALVASSFPRLETLTLNLDLHEATYDTIELVSVFTQFTSLRTVFLCDLYKRLKFEPGDSFENDRCMPPLQVDCTELGALYQCDETIIRAASKILQFTSLLATQFRNMDFFYFEDDMTSEDEKSLPHMHPGSGKRLYLRGMLPVRSSNRDVDAGFDLMKYPVCTNML
ncbi:hypothetical protein F5878DRAFT_620627 [Lentinula raphanica]|uniref:Uncharacterized protein n=1 Tax=Lentinula raphanica TaxID=153919 RepID=A0AA38UDS1_9AGAR|nr:hypothetical protein F5878DRAFT_620627 [Lentinula raphanica]